MSDLLLHIGYAGEMKSIPLQSSQLFEKGNADAISKRELTTGEHDFGRVIGEQYSVSGIVYQTIRCEVIHPVEIIFTFQGEYIVLFYAFSGFFVSHLEGVNLQLIAQTQARMFVPESNKVRLSVKPDGVHQPALFSVAIPIESKIISSLSPLYSEDEIITIIRQQRNALDSTIDFQKILFDLMNEPRRAESSSAAIGSMTTILFLKMIRATNSQVLEDPSGEIYDPDKRIVYNMAESIILGLDEALSINNLAKAQHLNPNKLKLLFKKHMGIPAAAFRISVRMQKARQLLTETELSIQEISAMVGYSNPNQFSTMFKKKMGYTPNQLRK